MSVSCSHELNFPSASTCTFTYLHLQPIISHTLAHTLQTRNYQANNDNYIFSEDSVKIAKFYVYFQLRYFITSTSEFIEAINI